MKKGILAVTVGMLIALLLINFIGAFRNQNKNDPDNYFCLVIETTQGENKTYFNFYDDNLELICQRSVPYSEFVSTNIDRLSIDSDSLYFVPVDGDWEGKNDMLAMNLKTGTIEEKVHLPDELDLDKYITVMDGEKFINSNVNGDSYICRIDKENAVKEYKKVESDTLCEMIAEGDRLYSFNYSEEGEKARIYVLEKASLKEISVIEMDCADCLHPVIIGGKLYCLSGETDNDGSLLIVEYNINNDSVTYRQIDEYNSAYYSVTQPIVVDKEIWFAASSEDGRSALFKYDLESCNAEKEDMGFVRVIQIAVKGNDMYALISEEADEEENYYMQRYNITNSKSELKNQYNIATQGKGKELYYAAGFYLR